MKKYIFILFFIMLTSVGQAEIKQIPDQTLLTASSIGSVHTIDSFLVSASGEEVSLFVYDAILRQYRFLDSINIPTLEFKTSKLEDSILVINSQDEKLYFVSLKNLPELQYLGFVDLQRSFADYTLIDNSLYIAGFYDGILRYKIQDYSQARFIDSSMTGILVTQLDHDSTYLYALDEYNGLLRYNLTGEGFGTFDEYLFVPLRSFAFTKVDSLFYLHLINGGFLVGDFNRPSGNNIVDSLIDLSQVKYLYATDSLLITTDEREITIIHRSDYSNVSVYPLTNLNPLGLLNPFDNSKTLMLPTLDGGLSFLTLDTSLVIQDGLALNGSINDIILQDSTLYMSSSGEPIHLFTSDSTGYMSYSHSLFENLNNSGQIEHNGDSLFVIYPDISRLTIITQADQPDSAQLVSPILVSPLSVRDMYYTGEQLYDNALIFIEHPFRYEVYAVSDSGYIAYENEWKFVADMTSLSVKDSIAVISDSKNVCSVYKILPSYDKEILTTINLDGSATESIFDNNFLYLFVDLNLYVLDFTNRDNIFIDTVLSIPKDVVDAVIVENYMFTVGTSGILEFDLNGIFPQIIDSGGLPGNSIEVNSEVIAVHDNQTIMLYNHEFPLSGQPNTKSENNDAIFLNQNYPNPFNLETVICYSLPKKTKVQISVYNIIGQKINTLIQTVQEAGNHTVRWNGKSVSGNIVASGIYLYMLETDNEKATKKMILLK